MNPLRERLLPSMNPLLTDSVRPDFDAIAITDFEPAMEQVLKDNRQLVSDLIAKGVDSWDELAFPIEEADDHLNKVWAVISHYNSVLNSDELRGIYKRIIALLTDYNTDMGQNFELYQAYQRLADRDDFSSLSQAHQQSIKHILRSFKLSGVALQDSAKEKYSELKKKLSSLSNMFSENVLDATQAWTYHIESKDQLPGLPESALQLLASLAKENDHESGYLLTLDAPCYLPVMTYCEEASIREKMYQAFMTRASDQGPHAGKWDNSETIHEILVARQAVSKLLSFDNYAEQSLATKMAGSVDEVVEFLEQLADKGSTFAKQELEDLKAFAKEQSGSDEFNVWDSAFYAEKLKQQRFDISQEELRPYFPAPTVLNGLFEVVKRLFNIEVISKPEVSSFHPDAGYYSIYSEGEEIAGFYLDLYARKNKRGGAWMADCRCRRRLVDGSIQLPVAFLVCNFTPPVDGKPSLLTHNEVTTLFHEFGHGLHHMLTTIEVAGVSGISGVPWDVVELPSQFLENWCWQEESLAMMSQHHETGEPLPKAMLDKMLQAKHFQNGMMLMRQIEFSLFDFLLHRDFTEVENNDVLALMDSVRNKVAVLKPPEYSRFSHAFSHIFSGGYAAGYYSYKWAEVLAADAFSRFEEEGIFNTQTGLDYKEQILQKGGSLDAMDMFVNFRGRKPSVDSLLKQAGMKV
ncbi:MAG: oligopeptidase A [Oleiphilaceae bacterium]|jgi:oligopeptidase A